jgi:hypothetical protein
MLRLIKQHGRLTLTVMVILVGGLVLLAWLATSEPEVSPFFYDF